MSAAEAGSNTQALFQAFIMIVVSEIGDKTFLIAAIMATRHARITVFCGAFVSLVVMSILSAALGRVILGLVPKVWTLWAAALLFLVFGLKMLQEALAMSSGHMQDEMREVEEELEEDASLHDPSNARGTSIPLEAAEEGRAGRPLEPGRSLAASSSSSGPPGSPSASRFGAGRPGSPKGKGRATIAFPLSGGAGGGVGPVVENPGRWWASARETVRRSLQVATSPVFAQAFVLTFLGEWGDRSQIATIALGGAHSIPVIAFGTILGHGLCTAGAVMGGRYLSTKISVKHISLIGAFAFLVFAVLYAVEAHGTPWSAMVDDGVEW